MGQVNHLSPEVTMAGFQDLKVWQEAKELAVEIYRITQQPPFSRDLSLKDQIRRAAVSVPSNVAEGDERGTNKEAVRFLYIAKGSLAELQTQLQIVHEIGYLESAALENLDKKCRVLGRVLGSLINVRASAR